ncbi:ankyrin repeat domain-containing protein [Candidatus Dependentiae bacterium]|nr:ankyrin repeat domain-containing protein [Candidatus Dependentiae bacterium]
MKSFLLTLFLSVLTLPFVGAMNQFPRNVMLSDQQQYSIAVSEQEFKESRERLDLFNKLWNQTNGDGITDLCYSQALYAAIHLRDTLLAEKIISNCSTATLNLYVHSSSPSVHICGMTPLLKAVQLGNKKVVQLLLDAQVDTECKLSGSDYDSTPLLLAASSKRIDIVDLLLKAGAKTDIKPSSYASTEDFIQWAIIRGDIRLIQCLLSHNLKLKDLGYGYPRVAQAKNLQDALNKAVKDNDFMSLLKCLSQKEMYINNTARDFIYKKLVECIEQDNIVNLRALLLQGCFKYITSVSDAQCNTLLHRAVQCGSKRCIAYLVSLFHKVKGLDRLLCKRNQDDLTPIELAVNNQEVLKLLLDLQTDVPELDLAIPTKSWCTIS